MATRSPQRRSASGKSAAFAVDPTMRIIVLHGKDPYLVTARTREVIALLKQEHGDIEQFEYDGETADPADVLDELRSYGLIQQHKLVVLNNADAFLAAKGPHDDGRHRRLMETYAKGPVDNATLLMRADTWRAGNLDKHIKKVGAIFKLDPPDADKATAWCMRRIESEYNAHLEPAAAHRLVEQIGPDLARLDVEMAKLAAFVGSGEQVKVQHVIELVGMSREEKVWEIQSAIASGSPAHALTKLRELMSVSNHPTELVIWAICDLLKKTHAAARLLREGVNPHAVGRQLRLFGDSAQPILAAAQRCKPAVLASLLRQAIETDANNKSGLGDSTRSLEVLTIQIADTIGAPLR